MIPSLNMTHLPILMMVAFIITLIVEGYFDDSYVEYKLIYYILDDGSCNTLIVEGCTSSSM